MRQDRHPAGGETTVQGNVEAGGAGLGEDAANREVLGGEKEGDPALRMASGPGKVGCRE